MYQGQEVFKFGIPNKEGDVTERVGWVYCMVCSTRMALEDWFREGGLYPCDSLTLPIGILCKIDIAPERRGRGLSHPAIERAKKTVAEKGCGQILLNADPTQGAPFVVELYRKHGFEVIGPSKVGHYMLHTVDQADPG